MIKFPLRTQLRVNILSGPMTSVVNVLVMAVSYPLYLHYLGFDTVGIWLLLSSLQAFAQLGLLGIGPAVTKLVAEERGRGNHGAAQAYLSISTLIVALTGLIAVATVYLFRHQIVNAMALSAGNSAVAQSLLPWIGLLTALNFLNQSTTAALAGAGRIDLVNLNVTFSKLLVLLLEAGLLFNNCGVIALLVGDFVGCAIIQLAATIQLKNLAGMTLFSRVEWVSLRVRRLLTFSGNMLVASLAVMLVSPFNKWALSRYAGVALVPIYDIAFNGSMQLRGLVEVGLRAMMPAISHRLARQTTVASEQVARLYKRTQLFLLATLPFVFFAIISLAKPLLACWLGHRFAPEIVSTFNIMLAAATISLIGVPAYYTLMACGQVRHCMFSHILAAVLNVAIIVGSIEIHNRLTIHTASVSVLLTMLASTLYLLYQARAALMVRPSLEAARLDPTESNELQTNARAA